MRLLNTCSHDLVHKYGLSTRDMSPNLGCCCLLVLFDPIFEQVCITKESCISCPRMLFQQPIVHANYVARLGTAHPTSSKPSISVKNPFSLVDSIIPHLVALFKQMMMLFTSIIPIEIQRPNPIHLIFFIFYFLKKPSFESQT